MMGHPKIKRGDNGDLWLNFGEHGARVDVAAISGDGRRVLLVREVGTAQIWDLDTGACVAKLSPDSPLAGKKGVGPISGKFVVFIESAALDVHGELALLGLNDETAVIYRVDTREKIAVLHLPEGEPASRWRVIRAVAFSADGQLALVGFDDRRVGVWTRNGARAVATLGASLGERLLGDSSSADTLVNSVSISPDGRYVFAGAADMSAAVFELESGAEVFTTSAHAERIVGILEGPTGVGWATSAGRLWLEREGRVEPVLETEETWAEVCFDGDRLLARCHDGTIVRWTFDGRSEVMQSANPAMWSDRAETLWLRQDEILYPESGCRFALRRGERAVVFEREDQLATVRLSATGRFVADIGWSDALELWDSHSGALLYTLACPGGAGCLAFAPDDELVAVGEIGHGGGMYERAIYVYATGSGELRWRLTGHDWQIRRLEFSPDGRMLLGLGDSILAWDLDELTRGVAQPRTVATVDRAVGDFTFAGDALVIVDEGQVAVYEGLTRKLEFAAPITYSRPWRISADARHILIAGTQAVWCFSLSTGELEREIAAAIPRFERMPPAALAQEHELVNAAALWRTPYGDFFHQNDGPRGWIEPLDFAAPGLVVVRAKAGAAIVALTEGGAELRGVMPFDGRILAARIHAGRLTLVGQAGRVIRVPLVSKAPDA
jgi:WD40 repeat protein